MTPTSDWPQFVEFAREHIASGDIDPVYPVLKHLIRNDPPEAAHGRVFAYLSYYSLASSESALAAGLHDWWKFSEGREVARSYHRYPTGVERRALRGGYNMARHLESLADTVELYGCSWRRWLRRGVIENQPLLSWERMRVVATEPWGNGRWASYKTCEVLWKVLDYPLQATDMGNEFSSGPREGLAMVLGSAPQGNTRDAVRKVDHVAEHLRARLEEELGHALGIEELETILCDWKSVRKGKYYVGHDIDMMLEGLSAEFVPEQVRASVLEARAATLPHAYLGELNGWEGVAKERNTYFRRTGKVATRV